MLKNLIYTVTGGLGLLISTIVLQAFVASPPSRAEFDAFKAESTRHLKNIDGNLSDIKDGQNRILEHLLNKEGNK